MKTGQPRIEATGVIIKSPQEVAIMRRAGRVVAETIRALKRQVRAGMTTGDLDDIAHECITKAGATPSFLGYRGYPKTICVSVNEQVVHGIPGDRVIKDGDIVSLDVGAIVEGYQGDAATTVAIGNVPKRTRDLLAAAEGALQAAIQKCRPGFRIGDLSWAVQQYVESRGFSVVRQYVGHGIGRALHEEPAVPNFGTPGRGVVLKPGLVLAIEPMVNTGGFDTRVLDDNWTVVTADGSLSAHFEHTIAIAEGEPEVLTAPPSTED